MKIPKKIPIIFSVIAFISVITLLLGKILGYYEDVSYIIILLLFVASLSPLIPAFIKDENQD